MRRVVGSESIVSETQNLPQPQGSTGAGVAVPDRFDDPALPPHRHRMTDVDPAAAKRAEWQVAVLFAVSGLGTIIALIAYFAIPYDASLPYQEYLGKVQLSNLFVGLGMFLALFGIGAGAVHWAKTLMPDDEHIEERHVLRGSDEDRAAAVGIIDQGAEESGIARRPLIRNSLIGAMALAPLPAVVVLHNPVAMNHLTFTHRLTLLLNWRPIPLIPQLILLPQCSRQRSLPADTLLMGAGTGPIAAYVFLERYYIVPVQRRKPPG